MATAMLGQHSTNYLERATHSRGYADNDSQRFQRWCTLWLTEAYRVLKPGGHLVAFGGTRSAHRLFVAAEDCGFEIRDQLLWLYGSGAPKSLNLGRAMRASSDPSGAEEGARDEIRPRRWDGWWTGVKPSHEPILLARKPLIGRVVDNVDRYGVGALNIDGCRVADEGSPEDLAQPSARGPSIQTSVSTAHHPGGSSRWPSNLLLSSEGAAMLDEIAGGPASRYFWVAKPSSAERISVDGTTHPTVKPLDLMRRLVRLVTPPGGTVLDPFGGSGTTAEACVLEGFRCTIVEREAEYIPLIRARVERQKDPVAAHRSMGDGVVAGQLNLFSLFEASP